MGMKFPGIIAKNFDLMVIDGEKFHIKKKIDGRALRVVVVESGVEKIINVDEVHERINEADEFKFVRNWDMAEAIINGEV